MSAALPGSRPDATTPGGADAGRVHVGVEPPEWLHPDLLWAVGFWRGLTGNAGLPARRGIDPVLIPARMLPMVFLVEHRDGWRMRLAGTGFWDLYGREITGMRVDELSPYCEGGTRLKCDYSLAVDRRQPVFTQSAMTWRPDLRLVPYQRVLLPFRANEAPPDGDPSILLGTARLLEGGNRGFRP